jgi:hypothetical protein
MLQKLNSNEHDVAITVTDGFIVGRASGLDVQLIGTYVDSPLTWAVIADPKSPLNSISDFINLCRQGKYQLITYVIIYLPPAH